MSNIFYYESPYLAHKGVPHGQGPTGRGSGRYPYGSTGNTPNSRKNRAGALFSKTVKQGKGKDNISPAEGIAKNAKSGIDSTKVAVDNAISLRNRINKKKTAKNIDLSKKSDKEMRDYINRVNLERQYLDAITPKSKSEGLEYVSDIIGVVGGIAGIATSAVIITSMVKNMRG